MDKIVKADIFFVVSTLSVVAISILLIIAIIYAISILRDAKKLSSRVREEGEEIVGDFSTVRRKITKSLSKIFDSFTKNNNSKKNDKNK